MLLAVGFFMDTYTSDMAPREEGHETDHNPPAGEARTGLQGARSTWGRLLLPEVLGGRGHRHALPKHLHLLQPDPEVLASSMAGHGVKHRTHP